MRYLIDPGHGGRDSGACLLEANIALSVGKILTKFLQDINEQAFMTREKDVFLSLQDRCHHERNIDVDAFISIHCNAAVESSAHGIEVWTTRGTTLADILATRITTALATAFPQRRMRYDFTDGDSDKESQFYVLRNTKSPAVLIELGFLSNDVERRLLRDSNYQHMMAVAIAAGILAW